MKHLLTRPEKVTPCAGVWIEIGKKDRKGNPIYVTPCAGVWIEISQHGLK